MRIFKLRLLSILFILTACQYKDLTEVVNADEYMVFGVLGGNCRPPCGSAFMISNEKVFQNKAKEYPVNDLEHALWQELPYYKTNIALRVRDSIPANFLLEPDGQLGDNHTFHDGTNFFIRCKKANKVHEWGLETYSSSYATTSTLKEEYRYFSLFLNRTIEAIQ
ncbi:MAG: hypothetical protein ABI844_13405 [Saprospiraceae bacterium]